MFGTFFPLVLGAATSVAIPDGIDLGPLITSAITSLVAVVAIACGGYVMFGLVRIGLKWLSVALKV